VGLGKLLGHGPAEDSAAWELWCGPGAWNQITRPADWKCIDCSPLSEAILWTMRISSYNQVKEARVVELRILTDMQNHHTYAEAKK